MSASVDSTVTVWQFPFSFLYLLLRDHVCHTRTGSSLCSTGQPKDSTPTRTGSTSNTTRQPKDNWLYSYRFISIMQIVSLRTAGGTHTGPSPFGNKIAWGQPATHIQVLDVRQQINLMTAGRTNAGPSPLGNKTAWGQPVPLRQVQQSENYLPACVTITSKALCADYATFNHPLSLSPVKGPCLQSLNC
jgi:hypothetical protein